MKKSLQHLIAAGLLAGLGLGAMAQTPPPAGPGGPRSEMHAHRGGGDPAKMQERRAERMERRLAGLKLKLALTPQQEGAWTAWTAAMKPAQRPQRPDREEIAKLPTPERIDRMKTLRAQRIAEMDRRSDATKSFYAALSADQKRVFDLETVHAGPGGRHGRHHGGHGRG